jgi:hypothetical protein
MVTINRPFSLQSITELPSHSSGQLSGISVIFLSFVGFARLLPHPDCSAARLTNNSANTVFILGKVKGEAPKGGARA